MHLLAILYVPYFYFCTPEPHAWKTDTGLIKLHLTHIFLLISCLLSAQEKYKDIAVISQPADTLTEQVAPADTVAAPPLQVDTLLQKKDTLASDTTKAPFIEAPIDYNAKDSIVFSLDGQKVFLYKDAKVTYQNIVLTADYIELDINKKEVYAEGVPDSAGVLKGTPVFQDGSGEYESKTLRYNFHSQKGIITDVKTKQGEGYVESQRTKKISQNVFILKDGLYTTCDANPPHFYLHLTKAIVIKDDKIITGPAYMVLEGFPIYFPILPFGFFPTNTKKYSSGILVPTYGEEANRGFFLRDGGYYWAATDYFDLSLKGDVYSKGSWAAKMHTNYRLRYRFSGSFNFNYSVNVSGTKGLNNYSRSPQFSLNWTHSQDSKANPTRNFNASVNLSTSGFDKQNTTDYNVNPDHYLQTQKSSSISYSKRWENTPFNMSVNLRHSQNSRDSTLSLSFPELTFAMAKIYPFKRKVSIGKTKWYEKFGINYSFNFRNAISNIKENQLFKTSLADDWQNGFQHNFAISLPTFNLFKYLNFSPNVSYGEKRYFKKYDYSFDPDANKIVTSDTTHGFFRIYNYSYSLSASTNIYGTYLPSNPNSRIKGIRHKMTANISLSYRPDFGKAKFGYWQPVQADTTGHILYRDHFAGGTFGASPGIGASGSIDFSLANSVEMKILDTKSTKDSTGSQTKTKKVPLLQDLSLNGSYNLIADSLNLSVIAIRARTTIKGIPINFSCNVDPYMMDSVGNYVTRVNKFAWNYNHGLAKLGRLTSANLSFGMSFSAKDFQKKSKGSGQSKGTEEAAGGTKTPVESTGYVPFNVPWNINFNYNFNYSHSNPFVKKKFTQTLGLSGSMSLTSKWDLSMNTNYDIMARQFAFTTFSVHRNLHCWSMDFSFVPFGYLQSYTFTLRASSSLLRDLKIDKTRSHYDNSYK